MKNQKKVTVKMLEAESGKKDSVRNLDGSNAYSNKHVSTIVAEFKERLQDLTLPDVMPDDIILVYNATGNVSVDDVSLSALVLNFVGQMPRK